MEWGKTVGHGVSAGWLLALGPVLVWSGFLGLAAAAPKGSGAAGGTATVTVSLNAGHGLSPGRSLGDVVVTCTAGGVSMTLNVPYLFVARGSVG